MRKTQFTAALRPARVALSDTTSPQDTHLYPTVPRTAHIHPPIPYSTLDGSSLSPQDTHLYPTVPRATHVSPPTPYSTPDAHPNHKLTISMNPSLIPVDYHRQSIMSRPPGKCTLSCHKPPRIQILVFCGGVWLNNSMVHNIRIHETHCMVSNITHYRSMNHISL